MLKWVKPEAASGIGMIVLQILRVFTVVTLATVCAACWVFIIKVDKERTFFVFECASLFITSLISVVLILSEYPLVNALRNYFRQTWPVLSDHRGLTWLGFAMLMLGCNILGNLNKPANDTDKLGPHFSKLVMASAVLCITFGVLNIVCSFVWRDGKNGITARDIRVNGSLAHDRRQSLPEYSSTHSSSIRNEKTKSGFISSMLGRAKKETGEKAPKKRPNISAPIPAYLDVEHNAGRDDRQSPIVPGLKRPDSVLHPSNRRPERHYSAVRMSAFG